MAENLKNVDTEVPRIFQLLYSNVQYLHSFVENNVSYSSSYQNRFYKFLRTVLVASSEFHVEFENTCNLSFQEIIYKVIKENSNFLRNQQSLSKLSLDENTQFLSNENFEELHKIIGDQLFLYLLTKCSLFEFVKENCYIQRTGIPIHILYRENVYKLNNYQRGRYQKGITFNLQMKENSVPILKYKKINSFVLDNKQTEIFKLSKKIGNKNDKVEKIYIKKKRRRKKNKMHSISDISVDKFNSVLKLMKKLKFNFSIEIPRYFIFSCKRFREQFPKEGNLGYALGLNNNIKKVLATIFSTEEGNLRNILTENQYIFLYDQMADLIKKHRTCPFKRFLKYYCHKNLRKKYISIPYLLEQHLSNKEVIKFLQEILKYVISPMLLGTTNFKIFLERIGILVNKGKNDILRLYQFFHGMKTKQCFWLKEEKISLISAFLFGKVLNWLLNYALCILQGYFYITESGMHKRMLFFYCKSLWQKIQALSINEILKQKNLNLIPMEHVKRLFREGKCFGISNVRFIPKSASLRSVFSLQKNTYLLFPEYNNLLQKTTTIFEHIKSHHPTLFGCAKETSMDVYHSWKLFYKQRQKSNHLYFVKMDLQDCFGSMNQDKLLQIVKEVLMKYGENSYRIRKYYALYEENDTFKLKFVCYASNLLETFLHHVQNTKKNKRNTIFVNLETEEYMDIKDALAVIEAYIFNCIIKLGRIYYRLINGICQGGCLSMMLCNLYLADFEKNCLSEFGNNPEELLMRFVDDFIYITPFKHRAECFMEIMLSGLNDFNLQVNPNKIIVNFFTEIKSTIILGNKEKLKWLGLLIDPITLNVSVDYTRYSGLSIGYSMSIDLKNPGIKLRKKMFALIILRFLPITLDTYINTEYVTVINIFENFLLLAYRMHHIIQNWRPKERMQNPSFLLDIIIQCANMLYYKCNSLVKQNIMDFSITKLQIQWICLQSFITKFLRHYEMYKPLLFILKQNSFQLKISKKKKLKWTGMFSHYPNDTFRLIFD